MYNSFVLLLSIGSLVIIGCSEDITVPPSYTISFDSQADNLENPAAISLVLQMKYGVLPTLERSDYSFGGWYTEKDGKGVEITSTSSFTIASNQTLYAYWIANPGPYTVTYNANGATSGTVPTNAEKSKDEDLTVSTNSGNLERAGYTFNGWNTKVDGTGTAYAGGSTFTDNKEATFYAEWRANQYTVTFNGNEGTPLFENKEVTYGQAYGVLATASRTGYEFAGWYATETGGIEITSSTTVAITAAQTLYAQWRANTTTVYTVYHYYKDGIGDNYTVTYTDTLTGTTGAEVTATAKSYGGFSEDVSHTSRVASGTIAADGTLVLKLYYDRVTYTVSFDSIGGSAVPDTTDILYGGTIFKPTDPTLSNYTFGAWYKDAALTKAWNFTSDTITKNITLYARWMAQGDIAYTVEHYQQNENGSGYSLHETEHLTGLTGTTAYASLKQLLQVSF